MKVVVGSDHRGAKIRRHILTWLESKNHVPVDAGVEEVEPADYPDIAFRVTNLITKNEVERGILVCGTGLGMSIAANKVPGIRAAAVHDDITAELSRSHNDSNIICLSADLLNEKHIDQILDIWLKTKFEGGRHARRLDKIREMEQKIQSQ